MVPDPLDQMPGRNDILPSIGLKGEARACPVSILKPEHSIQNAFGHSSLELDLLRKGNICKEQYHAQEEEGISPDAHSLPCQHLHCCPEGFLHVKEGATLFSLA